MDRFCGGRCKLLKQKRTARQLIVSDDLCSLGAFHPVLCASPRKSSSDLGNLLDLLLQVLGAGTRDAFGEEHIIYL